MSSRREIKYVRPIFTSQFGLIVGDPALVKQRSSADLRAVTSTIAIAAALSLGGLMAAPGAAFAGSCTTAGGVTVCSGPGAAGDSGYDIIFAGPGTVTTTPGFGLTDATGATANDAFYIRSNGDLSFVDDNASVISGAGGGIDIANTGAGSLTVTSNGSIAGNSLGGIYASTAAAGTTATITTNNVTAAGGHGIWLSHYGAGDARISVNNATASGTGILVQNNGSGTTGITVTGDVTGTGDKGIHVQNGANTTGSEIDAGAGDVSGGTWGILVQNSGSGPVEINSTGTVTGGFDGIRVDQNGGITSDLTINVNNVSGGSNGIWIPVNGAGAQGATNITVTGTATGDSNAGVSVTTGGTSTGLNLNVNNASGGGRGVHAVNNGVGAVEVISAGTLTGGIDGLRVDNSSASTDVTVTVNDTRGDDFSGVAVFNSGTGSTTITSTGEAFGGGAGYAGIYAVNEGSTTDLTIDAVDTRGNGNGIFASNLGTGATTVISSGTASGGAAKAGIHAEAFGTGLTVTSNNATGGTDGIYTEYHGTGTTTITSTGLAEGGSAGIRALSAGTAISIANSGTVRNTSGGSADLAIYANGPSQITNTGLITGTVDLISTLGNTVNNSGTWNTAGGYNWFGTLTTSNRLDNTDTIVAANDSTTSQHTVFNNVGTFNNGGLLTMGDQHAGDRTTIVGNYVGQGGTVVLDTALGDDSSLTDRLVISGNATGATTLAIRNAGGLGARTNDGIEVVTVGGTSETDAFRLASAVAAGAYDYNLNMGGVSGANNWYLRSTGLLNAEAQTTAVYAGALSNFAQATLGTLQQRTGNRIWSDGGSQATDLKSADAGSVIYGQGAWGRVAGLHSSYDPEEGSAYTQDIGFFQAGYEGVAHETLNGQLALGAYATMGRSRASVDVTRDSVTGAARSNGEITSNGYGLGINATWLGNAGLYADAIGQVTWYDSTLSSKNDDSSGWASALSLEFGQRFDLETGWSVVPQAQLSWTHVDFSSFTDTQGNRVALDDGDSLLGRMGVRVENLTSWSGEDGGTRRMQLYGIANLNYELLGGTSVKIAETTVEQQDERLWGEVGAGATYAWNDQASVYGEASYGHALASGDNYTAKGTVGLRYQW